MATASNIKQRLTELTYQENLSVAEVAKQLLQQNLVAQLEPTVVANLAQKLKKTPIELALDCITVAACYAQPTISEFYVGAIAIGESGTFYFGANQEFTGEAISQTIHAEQSAISHAWQAGEKSLTDIVVNYTPCGHCRQFMNELNSAAQLKIHLPHSQDNSLHSYLPDAFGPKDLQIEKVLFDEQHQNYPLEGDFLTQKAIEAANSSYAPYSGSFNGVALLVGEQVICGRYAENTAFNPTLPALQVALNFRRMQGLSDTPVLRAVMAEHTKTLSHKSVTQSMLKTLFGLELEYVQL